MIKNIIRLYGIADSVGIPYRKSTFQIEEIVDRKVSENNDIAIIVFGSPQEANIQLSKCDYKDTLNKKLGPFDILKK